MSKLSSTQDTLGDVAGTFGDIASDGADLAADLVGDLTDVAETAIDAVATTSRIGVRLIGRTVGFVARRPREVIVGVVIVAAVLAVLGYMKSNSSESTVS